MTGKETAIQSEPTPIEINPDSELHKRLQEATGNPITSSDHGVHYRVIHDADDIWADYDPERALRAVPQSAGILPGKGRMSRYSRAIPPRSERKTAPNVLPYDKYGPSMGSDNE